MQRTWHKRPWFLLVSLALALATAAPGLAQPPPKGRLSAADAERSDRLFREANELYKEARYVEAEALYWKAWEIKKTYDIAANLGHTELRLGKIREAAVHLEFALRNWPPTGREDPKQLAEQALADAKTQVTTVHVKTNVGGAQITIDGKPAGQAPLSSPLFIEPGTRTIEATLSGYEPAKHVVTATKGGSHEVILTLLRTEPGVKTVMVPGPPVPTGPDKPPPPPAKPSPILIVSGSILAGAALAAGIGFTVAANGASGTADEKRVKTSDGKDAGASACAGAQGALATQCAELDQAVVDKVTFSNLAIAGYAVAGTAAAATIAYAFWPRGRPSAQRVRAGAAVAPGGAAAVVMGTF